MSVALQTFHDDGPADHRYQNGRDTMSNSSSSQYYDDESSSLMSASLSRIQKWLRYAVFMLLFAFLIFVIWDSASPQHHYIEYMAESLFDWVSKHPFWGMLAVILIYILGTILFVPGSILTIGTGFAFSRAFQNSDGTDNFVKSVAVASTAVFVGATLGSICSFLLGRYLFRDLVYRLAARYPLLQAMDRALEHNGVKIMILLRLSPLIPYNALDYMSGVTSISLWDYSLALVGILPGVLVMCSIGATASSLSDGTKAAAENDQVRLWGMIMGVLFALAGVAVASYYSKVELDRIVRDVEGEELLNHISNGEEDDGDDEDDDDDNDAVDEEQSQQEERYFDRRIC